jgi:hypothetical protein
VCEIAAWFSTSTDDNDNDDGDDYDNDDDDDDDERVLRIPENDRRRSSPAAARHRRNTSCTDRPSIAAAVKSAWVDREPKGRVERRKGRFFAGAAEGAAGDSDRALPARGRLTVGHPWNAVVNRFLLVGELHPRSRDPARRERERERVSTTAGGLAMRKVDHSIGPRHISRRPASSSSKRREMHRDMCAFSGGGSYVVEY